MLNLPFPIIRRHQVNGYDRISGTHRGWPGNADATAEIWWDSHDDMVAAFSSPQGQAAGAELAADEAVFCEPSSVTAFLVEEHIVIDNPA